MASLSQFHTFGLHARCQEVVEINTAQELPRLIQCSAPYYLLGDGSNTIFVEDYDGQVVLNRILGVHHSETERFHELTVGAGENWHRFVLTCTQNGWHGLENLALIPGTVGAAPIQNIGAYGVEVAEYIHAVSAYHVETKERHTFSNAECQFSYRNSVFKMQTDWVVCEVTFRLPKHAVINASYSDIGEYRPKTHQALLDAVIQIRQSKLPDPATIGNAGSFFKNPIIHQSQWQELKSRFPEMAGYAMEDGTWKVAAAWLIDSLGFKQKRIGGISCHHRQPLVITNDGTGTGQQLQAFAGEILASVDQHYSIVLEPEVRLIGKNGLVTL